MHLNHQYSLNFTVNTTYREEDFITSTTHAMIHASVVNCTKHWGVNPYPRSLLLIGPQSSGKTHLAHIWSNRFGSQFLTTAFTAQSLTAPGYIIDDIHRFEAKDLLHLFNRINEAKKYLLLTTTCKPSFILPDLQSRLNATNALYLDLPDEDMTRILLMHHLAVRSLKVSMGVIEYLARRITRDYQYIRVFVEALDNFALESKRAITVPLVAQLLKMQLLTVPKNCVEF